MACKVFVSHATADKALVDALVRLLEGGIGVPYGDIFCSSNKGQGIRPGKEFKESIRQNLDAASVVVAVVSQNFYASQFCLCELGGVWLKTAEMIPLLVPPLKTSELSAVLAGVQILRLEEDDLDLFRDAIVELTKIKPNGTARWTQRRDEFLNALPGLLKSIKHDAPVPYAAHEKVVQERDDHRREVERQRDELRLAEKLNAALSKTKDAPAVAKIIEEHSTTPKHFERLVSAAQRHLGKLGPAAREALYQEFRGDAHRPDGREAWDDARRDAEEGEVVIDEDQGIVLPRDDHQFVVKSRAALSELKSWLEAPPEDFASWYEAQHKGRVPDIALRPFWKDHFWR